MTATLVWVALAVVGLVVQAIAVRASLADKRYAEQSNRDLQPIARQHFRTAIARFIVVLGNAAIGVIGLLLIKHKFPIWFSNLFSLFVIAVLLGNEAVIIASTLLDSSLRRRMARKGRH